MRKNCLKLVTILSTVFCLTACQGQNKGSFSYDSNYVSVIENLNVKQLRNADGIEHKATWSQTSDTQYQAFKEKIRVFSTKLSESFIKSDYDIQNNITISPLSIELCLGLAVYCANGQTRTEILDALDVDFETFNKYYKLLFDDLSALFKDTDGNTAAELSLTNSIWIDNDINLSEKGLDDLKNDYYCHSFSADFDQYNEDTTKAIEYFIEQKTHGLIQPDLQFSPLTYFVLMNTLYLKDIWNEWGGDLTTTTEVNFTNANGNVSDKALLKSYFADGKTLETEDYSCFFASTHYGKRIYFVKPNEGKALKDVFNKEAMQYVINYKNYIYQDNEKLERYHTHCVFPEFKASADIDLTKMFIDDFNVTSMFSGQTCDFSNIMEEPIPGYVDQFKHIAKLEVNKKGIEGAAVTYMAYAGAVGPDEYTDVFEAFNVDKEFGFILTNYDGDIIFSGAVTNID